MIHNVTLLQLGYAGDGVCLFKCEHCNSRLGATVSLSNHTADKSGDIPSTFPIKYCWECGVRFSSFNRQEVP